MKKISRLSRWTLLLTEAYSWKIRYPLAIVLGCLSCGFTFVVGRSTGIYCPFTLMFAMILSCFLTTATFSLIFGSIITFVSYYFTALSTIGITKSWHTLVNLGIFVLTLLLLIRMVSSLKLAYRRILHIQHQADKAKQEADKALKAKSEFLSNISHEIRTPLNAVIGIAQFLSRTKLNTEQTRFVHIIQSSSNQLLTLLNDILDMSKIEAGKIKLENIPFNLKQLLNETIECFSELAKEKGLSFKSQVSLKKENFYGDPTRLKQVLSNLLSNAIKFTPSGEVSISVKSSFADKNGNSEVRFSVSDTGIGMSQDTKLRLFENFFQANVSGSPKYGGTGLGLAIVKQITSLMNGCIEVTSEEGHGSEFNVTIPLMCMAEQSFADPKTLPQNDPHALTNETKEKKILRSRFSILLAEDNLISREIASIMLKNAGYDVDSVGTGIEVLNAANKKNYSIILMDCQMPELDGYQTTKKLREQSISVPIIAFTAHAFKEDRDRCYKAGMTDYISKPFSEETLISKLDYYTIRKQLRRQKDPQKKVLDLSFIQKLEKCDQSENKTLIQRLIELYKKDAHKNVDLIKQAVQAHDLNKLSKVLHKFKSSNSNLGLMHIVHTLELLENKTVDEQEQKYLLSQLEIAVQHGLQALSEIQNSYQQSQVKK